MSDALGRAALRPIVKAAITIQRFSKKMFPDVRLMSLVNELQAQADQANKNNLQRTEAMLMIQAHTLDSIFNELARIAALNMGEYIGAAETYLRLALKAQSQCRTTLETLAQIKNPSTVAFVKQANIASGPQQVNNVSASVSGPVRAPARACAGISENQPNKLLEQTDAERLDFGTAGAATGADTSLEAVGAVNGTENNRR